MTPALSLIAACFSVCAFWRSGTPAPVPVNVEVTSAAPAASTGPFEFKYLAFALHDACKFIELAFALHSYK